MLGIGLLDQSVSACFVHGAAFLNPQLTRDGYGLAAAGTLVAMPTVGVMSTLILWGVVVDRVGERKVLTLGLGLTAGAAVCAELSSGPLALGAFLLVGGMAAASCNSASGRIVVSWFPARRRGLAMGIRQMAQPLGVGIAALTTPSLADHFGLGGALWLLAGLAAVAAGAATMLTLVLLDQLGSSWAVPLLVLASIVTVADNGLAFASIAEVDGPFWSGRPLGTQNAAQFLAASIVAPAVGGLIPLIGYPAAFALVAVCPAMAAPMVPNRQPGPPATPPAPKAGSS